MASPRGKAPIRPVARTPGSALRPIAPRAVGPGIAKPIPAAPPPPRKTPLPSIPISSEATPPPSLPPSQDANKQSQPQSTPFAKSDEKKIDVDTKDETEIEDIKVASFVEKTEIDKCAICLDECTDPKQLNKCGHTFCAACIDYYFEAIKPQCPCCFTIYGEIRGNQPENGKMNVSVLKKRLPGFENNSTGTIQITYVFPSGIQNDTHPNPNMPYEGSTRTAYLPDNHDGQHVLTLLQRAFKLRQVFTIGQSRTSGCDNVVTWNDIHHKTSMYGGSDQFGYPDPTYLNRVQQELAAKGIE